MVLVEGGPHNGLAGGVERWLERDRAMLLDARVRDELTGLYQPRPDDLPAESTGAVEIAMLLTAHLGWSLLPQEAPPPPTAPPLGYHGQADQRAERLN